jgi:putative Ca2+/H+ antiporter (TMEM165/GDT1 family)
MGIGDKTFINILHETFDFVIVITGSYSSKFTVQIHCVIENIIHYTC